MTFTPSKFQVAIFEEIANGHDNLGIEAVAGSGKSTTIVKALELIKGKAIFLAFNKSIATELSTKVPANVNCATLHSAGFGMIRDSSSSKVIVDSDKIRKIMDSYQPLIFTKWLKGSAYEAVKESRMVVQKIVSLVKNTVADYNSSEELYAIADYYAIDLEDRHLPYIKYVMEESNRLSEHTIDFDDMVYLPVYKKVQPRFTYDTVMVDETQDLNKTQIELVLKMVSKNGRIIYVGDSKQSIYGFRGADVNSMQTVQEILKAKTLPLSVCYRCPTSHIELAKLIVPQIEAREGAPIGEIATIDEDAFVDTLIAEDASKTLILSRTNASLVSYAMKLIARGHKASIKGRDIAKGLVSLVKKFKSAETIEELQIFLDGWRAKEIETLTRRKHESAIQGIEDKYECICNVMSTCENPLEVITKLENLFNDHAVSGYVFSSVHRAKGLEAETVYILNPEKLPLVWKNQMDWEKVQEQNIRYVCLTRSKNRMVFVKSADRK